MKLGVDLFSLRAQKWNAHQCLDYCEKIGVDLVHFSEQEPFESLEDSYLCEVKSHADELGLVIEAGMGSICPTSSTFSDANGTAVEQVQRMLRVASILGSPVLRCFLGANADRSTGLDRHMQSTVETCQAIKSQAVDLSIRLAIENHAGDMQAWELKELIEKAGPDFVGACIDAGNPLWVAEDPLLTLEHLAPYVATSHVRDTAVWPHPRGAAVLWVAMGDGNVGIQEWHRLYAELCPDKPFTLEIISWIPPRVLNYLEEEYWETYPRARAAEFIRFERLVRDARPYMGPMINPAAVDDPPPEFRDIVRGQERVDLERSVRYCRETLSIGT